MPEETTPQQPVVTPETSEADVQAFLGIEDAITDGRMDARQLFADIVSHSEKYPIVLRPHLASFLGRKGLDLDVRQHADLFYTSPETANTRGHLPLDDIGQILKASETRRLDDSSLLPRLSAADAHYLVRIGYGAHALHYLDRFDIKADEELVRELLETPQLRQPLGISDDYIDSSPAFYKTLSTSELQADRERLHTDNPLAILMANITKFSRLPVDIADRLLQQGKGRVVIENLDRFPELTLDDKLARQLIDAQQLNQPDLVFGDLKLFKDFVPDAAIAEQLIAQGDALIVAQQPQLFEGLVVDQQFALQMAKIGLGGVVLDAADQYPSLVMDAEFAQAIVRTQEGRNANALIDHIDQFPELTKDIALSMLRSRNFNGQHEILNNLDRFKGLEADESLAKLLITTGRETIIEVRIDMFSGLSQETALRLAKNRMHGLNTILQHRDAFPGIRFDREFAMELVDAGKGYEVIRLHEQFDEVLLDESFAYELIDRGSALYVINSGKEFTCNIFTNEMAERMLGTLSNIGDLFAHLGKFRDFKPDADLAELLLRSRQGAEAVLTYAEKFKDFTITPDLADRLMAQGLESVINHHLDRFTYLSPEVTAYILKTNGVNSILSHLHRMRGLGPEDIEWLSDAAGYRVREFPVGANRNLQYIWFADHSYQDLGPEWNKLMIGQLVSIRLSQVKGESNLHDAAQWLADFKVPESGYDIATIEALRSGDMSDDAILEAALVTYSDQELESQLLADILSADSSLRARLALPTKDAKIDQLFTGEAHRLIYLTLLNHLEDPGLDQSVLKASIEATIDSYLLSRQASNTSPRLTEAQLHSEATKLLWSIGNLEASTTPISNSLSSLQRYGLHRKAYRDDTASWLMRNSNIPNAKLTKAWADRPLAVANGATDRVQDILIWQADNAFNLTIRDAIKRGAMPENITSEELLSAEWEHWRNELLRVESGQNTITAIAQAKEWLAGLSDKPKLLPADKIPLNVDGEDFSFEVLSADDPRGFTIGRDTGCCMTVNGVSNDCIQEGYQNPNAGFMALYGPDKRLLAQSFFFVNPKMPDHLVLDNIESNKGRDRERIVRAYQAAWKDYLGNHPEIGIQQVNVGTGYTDVDIANLPKTKAVPPLRKGLYSDADHQRRLLKLSW